MRLNEEIISFLTQLRESEKHNPSAASRLAPSKRFSHPADLIAECEHEGYLETDAKGQFRLSAYGHEVMQAIRQRLVAAAQLDVGQEARIAFVSARDYARFQKLSALGLSPGIPIRIEQKFPSYVILCEETQIALEEEIARDIYVWRN